MRRFVKRVSELGTRGSFVEQFVVLTLVALPVMLVLNLDVFREEGLSIEGLYVGFLRITVRTAFEALWITALFRLLDILMKVTRHRFRV